MLARTGGNEVFALLTERTGVLTDALRTERFSLMVMFILRAIADRARLLERRTRHGRPQLDYEPFVAEPGGDGGGRDGARPRPVDISTPAYYCCRCVHRCTARQEVDG